MDGVTGGAGINSNGALGSTPVIIFGGKVGVASGIVDPAKAGPEAPDSVVTILAPRRVSETQKNNHAEPGRFKQFHYFETKRRAIRTKPVRSSWR